MNTLSGEFEYLFRSSNIVDASNLILPAYEVADYGYRGMFMSCKKLIHPPKVLPADRVYIEGEAVGWLGREAYYDMFYGCTNMIDVPDILWSGYLYYGITVPTARMSSMFRDCTSITESPILRMDILVNDGGDLDGMFFGCTSLTKITSYVSWLGHGISTAWVRYVAPTGVFINLSSHIYTTNDYSEDMVPNGWTIINQSE